jgi:hypothetical protein
MDKKIEQKILELKLPQNIYLHSIFTMTNLQARIALCMIMYGADFESSLAASLRLGPGN